MANNHQSKSGKKPNNGQKQGDNNAKSDNEELNKLFKEQQRFIEKEVEKINKTVAELLPDKNFDLHEDEIKERAKKLAGENIKILYGVVKVIGLTTATIVLLSLLVENKPFDLSVFDTTSLWHFVKSGWISFIDYWCWIYKDNIEHIKNCANHMLFFTKMILWLVSCLVVILTYEAAMFATIYLAKISSEIDILVVFSFVGFEFFLFAILSPGFFLEKSIAQDAKIDSLFWWYIIHGLYTLAICVFCTPGLNMITNTKIKSNLGKSEELKTTMKNHLANDIGETSFVGFLNILFAFLPIIFSFVASKTITFSHPENKPYYVEEIKNFIYFLESIVALYFIIHGYKHQHVKRQKTYTLLSLPPTKNNVLKTIKFGREIFIENEKLKSAKLKEEKEKRRKIRRSN